MRRFTSSRTSVIGLAAVALISTAVVPSTAIASTNSTLGSVAFASGSTSLTATAKQTLGSYKTKIASKDTVTVTGYIRNHSGQNGAVALARATAVKDYLVSIGVTAKIKTVNGGVPRVGGSTASAEKATIINTVATIPVSKGTFKTSLALHYDTVPHASSDCGKLSVSIKLTPTTGGALTNGVAGKGVIRSSDPYYCDFQISQTAPDGIYSAKITLSGQSASDIYLAYPNDPNYSGQHEGTSLVLSTRTFHNISSGIISLFTSAELIYDPTY